MKKIWIPILLIAGLVGCKALNKLTQFQISKSIDYTVPTTLGISVPLDIVTPPIATNSSQEFKNNNTSADLIQSVKLDQMTIQITDAGTQDLSFLKDIKIYISSPGLSETLVAFKDSIPDNVGKNLTMDLTLEELRLFIIKDSFSLRTKITTDKIVTSDTHLKIDSRFFVDAKIFGI